MTDSLTLYVLAVIFIATLVRSTLGFGEALIAIPLLALRLPIIVAAPLAVMVSVLVATVVVAQDWRHVELRSASSLIVASLLSLPLGFLLLVKIDGHIIKIILGMVIILFSAYFLKGGARRHLRKDHWVWLIACGLVAGVLGGAYGMNGPPLAVYGTLRKWSPQHFRATLQGYFLPVSLIGLGGYIALGLVDWQVLRYFILSLPVLAVAIVLGRFINRRLKDHRFFVIVYAALIIVGCMLVLQAVVQP